MGFSYGFRPGRSQHQALDALWVGLIRKKVNWVLDADTRDFFRIHFTPQCPPSISDVEEGLVEVGGDVFEVLNAYGEADQAFGDAYALLHFFGHGSVGHQRGQGD